MADTQPALATTKRKFHKILDNIAASTSTPSLASTLHASDASTTPIASPEHPNKRPRSSNNSMDQDKSISASQARIQALKDQLHTPTRRGTVRVVGRTTASTTTTPRKAPNFQPHSQEQFLSRLKTFADVKRWTSKPDAIGEVQWAKRGWSCDTWNTVACKGGCEKRIAVRLRPKRKDDDGRTLEMSEDLAVEVDDNLVEKFVELIETGHSEDCLWRKRGCQDDIYHISIASRAQSSTDLLERYNSLQAVSSDLPLLENITYPNPSIRDILQRIPPNLFKTPTSSSTPTLPPSSPSDKVAFTFALFGWTGTSESRISLATCTHCFQRIGLWLSSDTRLKQMSTKLSLPLESLRLNLLESHREHCPWKNPASQANAPDGPIAHMPAWQTLQFIMLAKQKNTPSVPGRERAQSRGAESEVEYPRGSLDSVRGEDKEDETGKLEGKWKKFKAKLRRTTSKRSSKSVKSIKSSKSTATGKENELT